MSDVKVRGQVRAHAAEWSTPREHHLAAKTPSSPQAGTELLVALLYRQVGMLNLNEKMWERGENKSLSPSKLCGAMDDHPKYPGGLQSSRGCQADRALSLACGCPGCDQGQDL